MQCGIYLDNKKISKCPFLKFNVRLRNAYFDFFVSGYLNDYKVNVYPEILLKDPGGLLDEK